jgi:hypothetical protein
MEDLQAPTGLPARSSGQQQQQQQSGTPAAAAALLIAVGGSQLIAEAISSMTARRVRSSGKIATEHQAQGDALTSTHV